MARAARAVIELAGVSKRYGGVFAVRDVTLAIARGELVAIVGESGSGKTTLLKMVNRLVDPDAGRVHVDGRDIAAGDAVALRRSIGYVIQQVGLLPHHTVAANIALVPRLLGWSPAKIAARVDELLALVGLAGYGGRFPDELSGGQRQRIGVARALAARPPILLLDEPFGAVDPITRASLQGELRRIHDELGLTSLLVTHDLVEALTLADRVAVMQRGEVLQVAAPAALVAAPAHPYVDELVAMVRAHGDQLRAVDGARA